MGKEKNQYLSFIKGIAAVCVVLVHFRFPGAVGRCLCNVGLSGVILFLLISGYYAYGAQGTMALKLMARFHRNLKITGISLLVYTVFTVMQQLIRGTLSEWFAPLQSPVTYFKIFVLGDLELINAYPLWYMVAILYAYLILALVDRLKAYKLAFALMPVLVLARIGLQIYIVSYDANWHYAGNFLFGALPMMLLGMFFAKHREFLLRLPYQAICASCAVSTVLLLVFSVFKVKQLSITEPFMIWTAASFFVLSQHNAGKSVPKALAVLGEKYSLYIYLSHNLIGIFLKDVLTYCHVPSWTNAYLLPIFVILLSILFSAALVQWKNNISNHKKHGMLL